MYTVFVGKNILRQLPKKFKIEFAKIEKGNNMAIMKPKQVDNFTDEFEEKSYELLSNLDDSYTVIYEPSIGLHSKKSPDFIILSEQYGLIVLDTKFVKLDNIKNSNSRSIYKTNGIILDNFAITVKNYAFTVNNQLVKNLKNNINIVHSNGKLKGKLTFPHSSGLLIFIDNHKNYTKEEVSKLLSLDLNSFILCNDIKNEKNELESFIKNLSRPFIKGLSQVMQQEILNEIYMDSNSFSTDFINKLSRYNLPLKQEFQEVLTGDIFEKSKQLKSNILIFTKFAQDSIEYGNKNLNFGFSNYIDQLKSYKADLENEKFTIGVFGYFSNGKSTFLNALLGVDKLPMAEERLTATFTRIKHCEENEDFDNGEMEVIYKDKDSVNILYTQSLSNLSLDENKIELYNDFKNIDKFKDAFIVDLKNIKLRDFSGDAKERIKNAKIILTALLENNIPYGNREKIEKENIHTYITDDKKALFLEEVIYYLDNDLLRNIEIVDTPGYGSTNSLDTIKTHEFVKNSNAVILLTKSKTPMEEVQEAIFLEEYARLYQDSENIVDAKNLFIVANQVDLSEKSTDTIKKQICENIESDWEDGFIVNQGNLFTLSSKYHYEKQQNSNIKIKDYKNVQENDLNIFKDSFSKYLTYNKDKELITQSFNHIESTISDINKDFNHQIDLLNSDINDIKNKKIKFKNNRKIIDDEFNLYTDAIQGIQTLLIEKVDKELKSKEITITPNHDKSSAIGKVSDSYDLYAEHKGVNENTAKDFYVKYVENINKYTFQQVDKIY